MNYEDTAEDKVSFDHFLGEHEFSGIAFSETDLGEQQVSIVIDDIIYTFKEDINLQALDHIYIDDATMITDIFQIQHVLGQLSEDGNYNGLELYNESSDLVFSVGTVIMDEDHSYFYFEYNSEHISTSKGEW